MAYVRKKKVRGGEYYQLVEGRRENGKVRQKVLVHLGDCETVEAALKGWPARIARLREAVDLSREQAESLRRILIKRSRDDLLPAARFLVQDGEVVRRKASPHTYATARKWEDEFELGTPEWRAGFAQGVYGEYWAHIDRAEKLAREADQLETRLGRLRELLKERGTL